VASLDHGGTVSAEYLCGTIKRLRQEIRCNRPGCYAKTSYGMETPDSHCKPDLWLVTALRLVGYGPLFLESRPCDQWFPSLCTCEEAFQWQMTCNRRRREANSQLLATEAWHRFLPRRVESFGATARQMFGCQWWLGVTRCDVRVLYTPSATHVPHTHQSQSNVLGIAVFLAWLC
jgi:hypothetical protein